MSSNLLLIASPENSGPIAAALHQHLRDQVTVSSDRAEALLHLRRSEFHLILLDETAASDGETLDLLLTEADATPVLEISLATSSTLRVVRQTRGALARRTRDQSQARLACIRELKSELGASLSGLLLESELALRAASPEQAPRLRKVVDLAAGLGQRLRAEAS